MNTAGPGKATSFLLVCQTLVQPADGDRAGWTLFGYRDGVRTGAINLAGHGAAANASVATAQASAERVLAGQGVTTCGWASIDGLDHTGAYRTVVHRAGVPGGHHRSVATTDTECSPGESER